MVQPWLMITFHCYAFLSHATHLVKKRRLIRRAPHVSAETVNHDRFLRSNGRQRLFESNEVPKQQRIVIVAGPHKTASSSIQNNLYIWSSVDPQILPNWAWPVPHEVLEYCEEENPIRDRDQKQYLEPKGFYPLLEALNDGDSQNRALFRNYSKHTVVEFYRNALEKEWRDGYNLIMGTEALDFLGSDYRDSNAYLEKFLDVLPLKKGYDGDDGIDFWGADEVDVTVVVKFRAPRVQHLISVWHQCCMKTTTFMEFLIHLPDNRQNMNRIRILDSLRLAEVFLNRGLDVVLIDMSGITDAGYDISNVVACDILKASCTETKQFMIVDEEKKVIPEVKNVRKNEGKLGGATDKQLDRIEKVLRKYDCNYQHVLEHENLTVLYNYELDHIMSDCSRTKKVGSATNRTELVERIKSIALDIDDNGDDMYYIDTDINGG